MAVINISDCIYYISGPTNIGIIEERLSDTQSNLYMIDSGCNTEDGKRIFSEITEYFSNKTNNSYLLIGFSDGTLCNKPCFFL